MYPSAGSGSLGSLFVFFGVILGEEVSGVGNRVSGNNTMVGIQLLLEASLNMAVRSACFIDEYFFWYKSKLLVLLVLSLSAGLSGFFNYQMTDSRNCSVYCDLAKTWQQWGLHVLLYVSLCTSIPSLIQT